MDYVMTSRGLTFYVAIIILIFIDSYRDSNALWKMGSLQIGMLNLGQNVYIFLTKTKHTWFQARDKCSLVGNEHTNITIPTLNSDLMWTGDSGRYLPWVEYLVHVTGRIGVGNCLAVRNNDSYNYIARDWSATSFQICLKDRATSKSFYQQNMSSGTWIESFKLCEPSYMLSRYSMVINNASFSGGTYWLSNTRRWIQDTFTNPEFCIAARLKEDGSLQRYPLRCDRKLPGLCVGRKWTPTHVLSSDDHAPINKVLLISVLAATGFIILVATVIVIICTRRTSTRTERQPTLVLQNEVFYENESNTLSRNQTGNDTIDRMHYQSLNQNRNPIDNNYDILHNTEVDITSDRQPQRVIDETVEQRQMEADYQEIKDVSI